MLSVCVSSLLPLGKVIDPSLLALGGTLKELVPQETCDSRPGRGILIEAAIDESAEAGRPLVRDRRRRAAEHGLEERVCAAVRRERGPARRQLIGEDAEGPNVDFLRVRFLLDDFRRDPLSGAQSRPSEGLLLGQKD